jgi:hypothetical protein
MIECGITPPRSWTHIVPNAKIHENQYSVNPPDKIIRKLEDFPELVEALRNGNQVRARLLFAQLFESDSEDLRETRANS